LIETLNRPIRIYPDTSVFGGVFDREFEKSSRKLFDLARQGIYRCVLSALIRDELEPAPFFVKDFFYEISEISDKEEISKESIYLQQEYLKSGIVSRKWETDALHVAIATVTRCRIIVSWNFKHIVNFQKISMYNLINNNNGYESIAIQSPAEVVNENEIL